MRNPSIVNCIMGGKGNGTAVLGSRPVFHGKRIEGLWEKQVSLQKLNHMGFSPCFLSPAQLGGAYQGCYQETGRGRTQNYYRNEE